MSPDLRRDAQAYAAQVALVQAMLPESVRRLTGPQRYSVGAQGSSGNAPENGTFERTQRAPDQL